MMNPGNMGTPGIPGTPGTLGTPGTPGGMGTPGTPGGLGTPGGGGTPGGEGTPGGGGTPGGRGTPGGGGTPGSALYKRQLPAEKAGRLQSAHRRTGAAAGRGRTEEPVYRRIPRIYADRRVHRADRQGKAGTAL